MVFSFEDYPFTSKSGVKTELNKRSDYERHFLDAMKSGIKLLMKAIKFLYVTFFQMIP